MDEMEVAAAAGADMIRASIFVFGIFVAFHFKETKVIILLFLQMTCLHELSPLSLSLSFTLFHPIFISQDARAQAHPNTLHLSSSQGISTTPFLTHAIHSHSFIHTHTLFSFFLACSQVILVRTIYQTHLTYRYLSRNFF